MKNFVSLLPAEYKARLAQTRKIKHYNSYVSILIAVMLAFSAASGGMYFFNSARLADLEEEYVQINDEIIVMSKYEVVRKEMSEIKERVTAVTSTDPVWLAYIAQVSQALPNGVWVESINSQISPDGLEALQLLCGSNAYSDISQVIRSLYTQSNIIRAYCSSSSEANGLVSFTLEITKSPNLE